MTRRVFCNLNFPDARHACKYSTWRQSQTKHPWTGQSKNKQHINQCKIELFSLPIRSPLVLSNLNSLCYFVKPINLHIFIIITFFIRNLEWCSRPTCTHKSVQFIYKLIFRIPLLANQLTYISLSILFIYLVASIN